MAKKASKDSRIAAIRDKLKKTDMGSSRGFWSPTQGVNDIRILPETGKMPWFFQEVGRHYLPGEKKVYCPNFTTDGEKDCPICDLVGDLYSEGSKSSKKLAGKIRVRKMYWMNIVVRDGDDTLGPFIYTPGVTVFSYIAALLNDPEYGEDIIDELEGIDIAVERSGTGLETSYQVVPRRKASPVAENEKEIESILEKAQDLSWVEVSEDPEEDKELSDGHAVYILPYDRIANEYELEDDLDEDEEEHEIQREVKGRRRRRARK